MFLFTQVIKFFKTILPLKEKRLVTCCGFLLYSGSGAPAGWSLSRLIPWHPSSLVSHRLCRSCQWSGRGVPSELLAQCSETSTGKTLKYLLYVISMFFVFIYQVHSVSVALLPFVNRAEVDLKWTDSMQRHSKYYFILDDETRLWLSNCGSTCPTRRLICEVMTHAHPSC